MKHCIYCHGFARYIHGKMLECKECGSIIATEPAPPYKPDYHAYRFSYLRPKLYYLGLKAMRSGLKPFQTIADIGCGAGHALWWAKFYDCETIGIDVEEARPHCRADNFYSVDKLALTDFRGQVDLVWCWHTIEHTDDPHSILALTAELLKPGGQFYLEFPCADYMKQKHDTAEKLYRHSTFPEHRGLPSEEWAVQACMRVGLSLVNCYPPRNPAWLYGKMDDNTDMVVHCEKRKQ